MFSPAPIRRPTHAASGHRAAWLGPALVVGSLAWPGVTSAQSASERAATAQGLYESAVERIKAGRIDQACPKLEESQRLDPAMGTQFFLATCYEGTGRPTSAWSLFIDVAATAKAAGNTLRETTARARAAALEPRLPRMTVILAAATAALPGLEVTRDELLVKPVVWGSPVPVDMGEHTVRATAPGKVPFELRVRITQLGQRLQVDVPPLLDGASPVNPELAPAPSDPVKPESVPPSDPAPGAPPRPSFPAQRIAAVATGSVGVAGLVAGGVLGLMARWAWRRADAACPRHLACTPEAHAESARSLSLATGSTITFIGGGAAVAGGLILWLTTPASKPSADPRVVPVVGPGVAGAMVTGAF